MAEEDTQNSKQMSSEEIGEILSFPKVDFYLFADFQERRSKPGFDPAVEEVSFIAPVLKDINVKGVSKLPGKMVGGKVSFARLAELAEDSNVIKIDSSRSGGSFDN